MAIKRIPCGGFFYDDESIEFDGRVIKASGGGDLLVTVTDDEESETGYSADKTFAEIKDAILAGKNVRCVFSQGQGRVDKYCFYLSDFNKSDATFTWTYLKIDVANESKGVLGAGFDEIIITSRDEVKYFEGYSWWSPDN